MKRILATMLCLILVFGLSASAFAAEAVPSPEPTPRPNPLDSIDIPRSTQREIYDAFEELSESTKREEGETIFQHRSRIAEQVAEQFGVSAEDVEEIYSYGLTGYLYDFDPWGLPLLYGEKMDAFIVGTTLEITAKVNLLLSNDLTIAQNYHNVVDLIQEKGCGELHTINYTAYADGASNEVKIMSFTLTRDVIEAIASLDYSPASILDQFVTNLWIHRELQ